VADTAVRTPQEVFDHHGQALEWKARSSAGNVEDGIDTFVFRDGMIRVQTVRYTVA